MFPSGKIRKSWRNAVLGTLLVLAGLGTAALTVLSKRDDNPTLTSAAAIASLAIVLLLIVLVLPPLAKSARSELGRIDLPLEITGGGVIFVGILVVVAFAAWNTGNNLLFLVFSILTSTLFVSWMTGRLSLSDLVVSARFPDHIFAGEAAPVIVTVHNRKRLLPSFSILVEARGPLDSHAVEIIRRRKQTLGKRVLSYFAYIPHHTGAEQRVEQIFEKRGHVVISGFELSTRFPFGFFRLRRRLRARDVDIVVYPKIQASDDELHSLPMNAGRIASNRRGFGHDLLALRDYQPQDDLRYIDWKATARSRQLTVREFTSEDERRVTIALDTALRADLEKAEFLERFERGVSLAASLVSHFIDEGAELKLVTGSETGNFGSGREHFHECLRRLALVHAELADFDPMPAAGAKALKLGHGLRPTSESGFIILLTTAPQGSIPPEVWRSAHVLYI
jgi:uncharacterized protein (DUF58 family)